MTKQIYLFDYRNHEIDVEILAENEREAEDKLMRGDVASVKVNFDDTLVGFWTLGDVLPWDTVPAQEPVKNPPKIGQNETKEDIERSDTMSEEPKLMHNGQLFDLLETLVGEWAMVTYQYCTTPDGGRVDKWHRWNRQVYFIEYMPNSNDIKRIGYSADDSYETASWIYKWSPTVECNYCHEVFNTTDPTINDHWKTCKEHPALEHIEQLNARISELAGIVNAVYNGPVFRRLSGDLQNHIRVARGEEPVTYVSTPYGTACVSTKGGDAPNAE